MKLPFKNKEETRDWEHGSVTISGLSNKAERATRWSRPEVEEGVRETEGSQWTDGCVDPVAAPCSAHVLQEPVEEERRDLSRQRAF